MPNFAQLCHSAQCSAFCVNADNKTGKKLENTLPGIRTISWSHVCTVQWPLPYVRFLDVHFFKSIFEISLYLYPIKHPSTHQLLRIWPQDLRWISSLHHSKHHTVKIAMLNSALGVVLVQQQNFPGQGFKMRVLVLGELLAGGRTCLSHISFSSLHFLIPETWITLISVD